MKYQVLFSVQNIFWTPNINVPKFRHITLFPFEAQAVYSYKHVIMTYVSRPVKLLFVVFRGVRPFGVSLLIAGWDEDEEKPYLYQCDPSVSIMFIMHQLQANTC